MWCDYLTIADGPYHVSAVFDISYISYTHQVQYQYMYLYSLPSSCVLLWQCLQNIHATCLCMGNINADQGTELDVIPVYLTNLKDRFITISNALERMMQLLTSFLE